MIFGLTLLSAYMPELYHYCSTETFVSIITNKSIRLSSLTMSNDSKEGELIKEHLMRAARESGLYPIVLGNLERALQFTYEMFDGLGFCLSENGDLLSQWRGYADDGRGISIGFNSEYLSSLSSARSSRNEFAFNLCQILYDPSKQAEIANEHLEALKPLFERGAFRSMTGSLLAPISEEEKTDIKKATEEAYLVTLKAMLRMFEIKHPAFAEELEWRLISISTKNPDNQNNRFRACGDKIVPYVEIPLEQLDYQAISTVILGPRHTTPPHVIKQMFHNANLPDPAVIKSAATYR